MPKDKQRVAIAADVLKQLSAKTMVAQKGTYLGFSGIKKDITKIPASLQDLFKSLKKEKVKCQVCGIGSCFVSLVGIGNRAKSKTFVEDEIAFYTEFDDSEMRRLLRKVFPPAQISLIECAFEVTTIFSDHEDNKTTHEERQAACEFGLKYESATSRLRGIMNNIIINNGTFKP